MNPSTVQAARPTKSPSMSGSAVNVAALPGSTLPPYRIGISPPGSANRSAHPDLISWAMGSTSSGLAGSAPGADRPDWLVGDLNQAQLLGCNAVQADLQLPQHGLPADAERSLLGGLANGEKDAQVRPERRQHLPLSSTSGLMEVPASLGMSQQD